VRGEDLYFDATKVDANASLEAITPRFAVEEHLDGLFEAAKPDAAEGEPDALASRPPTTSPCWPRTRPRKTGSPATGVRGGR